VKKNCIRIEVKLRRRSRCSEFLGRKSKLDVAQGLQTLNLGKNVLNGVELISIQTNQMFLNLNRRIIQRKISLQIKLIIFDVNKAVLF